MNKRENWLRAIRNDSPAWIPLPWEPFAGTFPGSIFFFDPISASLRAPNPKLNKPFTDAWGVQWLLQEGSPAPTPIITDENKIIKDITAWPDFVKFPPLDGFDFSEAKARAAAVDRRQEMLMPMIAGGLFEMSHNLMGFEDALVNYLTEPVAMSGLLAAIADWKIGLLERILDQIPYEVIHFHDDWGSKDRLFMAPDVWRHIVKPQHQRIVDCVKSHPGVLFMHHSDSICEPIAEDMADMGIDIWQGAIPQNDIVSIQKKLNGRMAIMGGIDAQVIDRPDFDEDVIRGEVRRCISTYWPQGHFIPCIPNITAIYPEVDRIYLDEIRRQSRVERA